MMSYTRLLVLLLSALAAVSDLAAAESPEAILDTFEIHPEFTLELAAKEPLVYDPVDLTFDEHGDAYVMEMPGYPFADNNGRIVCLQDTDRDGAFDTRTVFAEGFPVGDSVLAYDGGFLVASPPDLVFVKDTTGDGRADVREVMLTGFADANTQHNFNGLTHGIDNWIYGANGGNSGNVHWPEEPGAATGLRYEDFRVELRNRRFERIGRSTGGFELGVDAYNRIFGTHNLVHIQHLVFDGRYLTNVPAPGDGSLDTISDHEEGGLARIFPIGTPAMRVNHPEQSGYFSGACGITYYGGGAFPEAFNGNLFVTDVVLNLIHRDVITEDGASYTASRGRERVEFLASTDRTFRPVNMTVGPDGAHYVLDMHRPVIEHPEWIPDEIEEELDVHAGKNEGRLFRVVPKGGLPAVDPSFSRENIRAVVGALAHENKWWRDTAQRLLVQWQAREAVEPLKRLFKTSPTPVARLHALYTMEGLEALSDELVAEAMNDAAPGVREHAVQLAEQRPALHPRIAPLASDSHPRVRMQVALSLGAVAPNAETTRTTVLRILQQDVQDPWVRLAAATAADQEPWPMLEALSESQDLAGAEGAPELARMLAEMIGERRPEKNAGAVIALTDSGEEALVLAALDGLAEGLEKQTDPINEEGTLFAIGRAIDGLIEEDNLDLLRPAWRVAALMGMETTDKQRALLDEAATIAADRSAPKARRAAYLKLLAFAPFEEREDLLFQLLDTREPEEIQRLAIEQLGEPRDTGVAKRLIDRWRSLGPETRSEASDILLYKRQNHDLLLTALENGRLSLGALNLHLERRRVLLRSSDESIRERAKALFSDAGIVTRKEALDKMRPALELEGNPRNGEEIFSNLCAKCHRIGEMGEDLGPNLTDIFRKSPETLLHDIIDPNAAVDTEYVSYAVETTTGQFVNGIVARETDDSVTIRQAEGQETTVARDQIAEMWTDGLSLMPEELEIDMSHQEMADLLAFLLEPR